MARDIYHKGLRNPLTFNHDFSTNGVDQLDPELTINGTTVTPMFRYKGGDADATEWAAWGYGTDIPHRNSGTDMTFNTGSPLLSANDDSVLFNGGDNYFSADATPGDVTTEDIVIELLYLHKNPTLTENIFRKKGGGVTPGWDVFLLNNTISIRIANGTSVVSRTATISTMGWIHVIIFVNRDEASTNGSRVYANGVELVSGTDFSAVSSTLTSTTQFTIGSTEGAIQNFNSNLAYTAMWKQDAWHQAGASGPTEWAAIAAERFAKLTGTWAGSSKGTKLPTTATRASEAYLDKVEGSTRKLYQVGDHWMRVASRNDAAAANFKGYLSEIAITNLVLQSETLDNASWGKTRASITANSIAAPNKEITADTIVEDGTAASTHYAVTNTYTITSGLTYTHSIWCKAANRNWVRILVSDGATDTISINLATGAKGSGVGSGEWTVEDWGDGWYRISCTKTSSSTSGNMTLNIAEADNDVLFDGLSQDSIYAWGAQAELADYMTSYKPTTTSGSLRITDILVYKGDDGVLNNSGKGSVEFKFLVPDYNINLSGQLMLLSLSDGGSSSDSLLNYIESGGTKQARIFSQASGGNSGATSGSVDVTDGEVHTFKALWATNNLRMNIDDAQDGSADTTFDMPDDIDQIAVGSRDTNTRQMNGLINNIKIKKK